MKLGGWFRGKKRLDGNGQQPLLARFLYSRGLAGGRRGEEGVQANRPLHEAYPPQKILIQLTTAYVCDVSQMPVNKQTSMQIRF
jgi:hypothetical protein